MTNATYLVVFLAYCTCRQHVVYSCPHLSNHAVGRYTETSEGDYLVSYLANLSRVPAVHDSKTAARGEQPNTEFIDEQYRTGNLYKKTLVLAEAGCVS